MAERIGIDLGGTKIELVVLAADGSVRWRRRVATPQGDYAGTLRAIVPLIHDAETAIDMIVDVTPVDADGNPVDDTDAAGLAVVDPTRTGL